MRSVTTILSRVSGRVLALFAIALVLTGASCFKGAELTPPEPVTLTIWRTTDTNDAFDGIVEQYQAVYPYVDFEFRVLRPDEYEEQLFAAWARGEGPDIFSVPNWRVGKFRDVIAPMPAEVTLKTVRQEKSRFGGTNTVIEENAVQQLSAGQIENLFAGPVASDVVTDEQIYGLPMSLDTLALYYNRDLLSRAGVAVPPTTWNEFVNVVQANGLIQFDEEKNIVQAAASLGSSTTVPYFFDLLSVLMMQNGVTMLDDGKVAFGSRDNLDTSLAALSFYSSFADPSKATYTWNDEQQDGLEAFIQGTSAMYFGYYRDQEVIEQRATGLNFSRTKLPQVDPNNPVNYATYPVETVHIQSPNANHAWNFLRFAATSEEQARTYLESTGRVAALRTIVGEQQQDAERDLFAQQTLTARSWYHGVDPDGAIAAMQSVIDTAVAGTSDLEDVVSVGASAVGLTLTPQEE